MKNPRPSSPRYQTGVSKSGLLLVIVLIFVGFTFGAKVIPIYVDHNLIVGSCEALLETGQAAGMSQSELRTEVSNSLRINNVHDFDVDNISLRKEGGSPVITIAYERRTPLIANLDIVAVFDETLQ